MNQVKLDEQFAFGKIGSLGEAFNYLITPGFEIAAIAVVFYFIFGAFKYLTSAGDKAAVESARNMITHAIIGFILLMVLFLILQFIPEFFNLGSFRLIQ